MDEYKISPRFRAQNIGVDWQDKIAEAVVLYAGFDQVPFTEEEYAKAFVMMLQELIFGHDNHS